MPRGKVSRGVCAYCGKDFIRSGMAKHLPVCPQRLAAIEAANAGAGQAEALYYLRVINPYIKAFWLELEMRGSASLNDLDKYLRGIWLECCGHLSQFSYGSGFGSEIGKRRKIGDVFQHGATLTHIYDFGSSTETTIEGYAVREGKPTTPKPIALMARNLLPEVKCAKCENTAEWVCAECAGAYGEPTEFCAKHIKACPHWKDGSPVRIVNSPRVGVCGYDGDAEPPY